MVHTVEKEGGNSAAKGGEEEYGKKIIQTTLKKTTKRFGGWMGENQKGRKKPIDFLSFFLFFVFRCLPSKVDTTRHNRKRRNEKQHVTKVCAGITDNNT
jgi:hypothetical protein